MSPDLDNHDIDLDNHDIDLDNHDIDLDNHDIDLDNHDIDLDNLDPTFRERKSFEGGFQLGGFYECASSLQSFFFFWPSGIYDCL